MSSISHKIFLEMVARTKDAKNYGINVSKFARDTDISITGLFYKIRGIRKWSADDWLAVLAKLGAMEVHDDRIVIYTNHAPELKAFIEAKEGEDQSSN